MEVFKCEKCGKTLFEGDFSGTVVKICPKCKHKNVIKRDKATPHKDCCADA